MYFCKKENIMITQEEFKAIHSVIANAIKGSEFEDKAFYVGGCVRDILLKKSLTDIHIVVSKPDGAVEFANYVTKKLGISDDSFNNPNPIEYPHYGQAQFVLSSALPQLGDVVINVNTSSKNASTTALQHTFGTLKEDALSRDFTINAIYAKISNLFVFDLTQKGIDDLANKKIRCANTPNVIFNADPVRILRAIRLASQLGFGIDSRTWVGMCNNVKSLNRVGKYQTRRELTKLLLTDKPSDGIRRMYHCGVLHKILHEVADLKGITQGKRYIDDAFDHTLNVLDKTQPIIENRLASLLHDIGKSTAINTNLFGDISFKKHETLGMELAEIILEDLKFDTEIVEQVKTAILNHNRFKQTQNPSNQSLKKFLDEVGEDNVEICLDLIEANNLSKAPKYCINGQTEKIRHRIAAIINKRNEEENKVDLPVNGNDIMLKFNLKKGPIIGRYIQLLNEYKKISPKMTKEEAFAVIAREIEKKELN